MSTGLLKYFLLLVVPIQALRFSATGTVSKINGLLPNPLPGLTSNFWPDEETDWEPPPSTPLDISTLRFVSVVTRHGSRSPLNTYPKDPYPYTDVRFWPDGVGQLTRYGKQQMYSVGQTYRMRYNGFLSKYYHVNDSLTKTNLEDRDFMSAACILAGLYPPHDYQQWHPFILWQPIPIWEDPFDISDMLDNPTKCPRYSKEQTRAINNLNQASPKYKRLFQYLTQNTGIEVKRISDILHIWDPLTLDTENGYKLPKWTIGVYPEKLAPLYAESFATLVAGTPEMIRLSAGPILRNISNMLNEKANGVMVPDRKLFIEAAHDVTLQAILSGLGFTQPFVIDTSANMIFELHNTSLGYAVQVLYYNNSAHVEPNILQLPCGSPCPLSEFNDLVDLIAPDDWEEECKD